MAKDPAFLFYSSDFYMGTIEMTPSQVGYYIRLLCLQHVKGHLSEALMTSTMGGEFDEAVACKFLVDENRCYYNERLDEEAKKRNNFTESRRKNLSTSPTHMQERVEQHMQEHSNNNMGQHMENENRNVLNVPKKRVVGGNKTFQPPTIEEVKAYCSERGNSVNPSAFLAHYEANGWVQGRGKPIKDWKAAVRVWENSGFSASAVSEKPVNVIL
jgi:hypothetical protein